LVEMSAEKKGMGCWENAVGYTRMRKANAKRIKFLTTTHTGKRPSLHEKKGFKVKGSELTSLKTKRVRKCRYL